MNLIAYAMVSVFGSNNTVLSIIIIWCVIGLGVGFIETIAYDLIISSVPLNKSGAASGIAESAYELGLVLGAAMIGSLMNWGYRMHFIIPEGLSDQNINIAKQTYGAAVDVADKLASTNPDLALELSTNAKQAFLYALPISGIINAFLMLVSIFLAWKILFSSKHTKNIN